MKRMIAILLAVLMLTGILTACSGTVGMDDGRAYGNVSTTPNGTVNGTNRNGGSYNNNGNAYYGNGGYQSNGSYQGNGAYNNYGSGNGTGNSNGNGTGMIGGR